MRQAVNGSWASYRDTCFARLATIDQGLLDGWLPGVRACSRSGEFSSQRFWDTQQGDDDMKASSIGRVLHRGCRPLWPLLALLTLIVVARVGSAQTMAAPPAPPEKVFDPTKVPFNTKVLREDMKREFPDWPKDSATGATVKRLGGPKVGLPAERFPGVKFLKLGEVAQMDVRRQKAGLFLVGIDFVPPDLERALKEFGFTLKKDGSLLDRNGEPIVAFVSSELYMIERQGEGGRSGALMVPTDQDLLSTLTGLFTSTAEAASPFPWRCYSFTPWAVYHGGFHRWYDARTWASSYGADGSGGCSWASPLTNIDYIATRAAVGWPGNENHCFGCNSEYSRDVWDVGYFWPAHGVPITTHTGVWADGGFSFSRSANLTW